MKTDKVKLNFMQLKCELQIVICFKVFQQSPAPHRQGFLRP